MFCFVIIIFIIIGKKDSNLVLFSFETNVQKIINEIQEEEKLLEEIQSRLNKAEVKRNELKMSLEKLCGMPHFFFVSF